MENNELPCWEPCQQCDEHWCNFHDEHAHDCACPPIEWWVALGLYPYETTVGELNEALYAGR